MLLSHYWLLVPLFVTCNGKKLSILEVTQQMLQKGNSHGQFI